MAKAKRKTVDQAREADGQAAVKERPEIAHEDQRVALTISLPRRWKKKLMVCAIQMERDASDIVLDAIKPIIEPYVVQLRPKPAGGGEQRSEVLDGPPVETVEDLGEPAISEE